MLACATSVSAHLEICEVETRASTSATLTPVLRSTGVWPVTLWRLIFPGFHRQECSAHITLSRMKERDKTQLLHASASPGSSCPIQIRSSEEGTDYIIRGLPVRLFIRTS